MYAMLLINLGAQKLGGVFIVCKTGIWLNIRKQASLS
jgi:hypothetical protein